MKRCIFVMVVLISLNSCNLPDHYFDEKPECNRSIEHPNPKLDLSYEVQSIYRNQLKESSPEAYRYFFEEFREEGDQTFMITNFRNETECFTMKILVEDWSKLKGMRVNNGEGYPKELFDLKWIIKEMNDEEEIIYSEMHRIID